MATVFAAGIILYSSLWMYVVRRPVAPVELGFRSDYSEKDHSLAILNVLRGSPAEKAGLQAADHILAANGRSLESIQRSAELAFHTTPGREVEPAVERGKRTRPR